MRKIKGFFKNLIQNEDGQGMTEYMLLLVLIIALGVLFKPAIEEAVQGKLSDIKERISSFGN